MSLKSFSTLAALIGTTSASGCAYDYLTDNGGVGAESAWAIIVDGDCATEGENKCGGKNQSPIALFSEGNAAFDYKIHEAMDDAVTKKYSNQYDNSVKTSDVLKTTKMTLATDQTNAPLQETTNYYTSNLADSIFQTGVTKWQGMQFHMHSGSEHTIDGVRHDLEMHTVHYPAAGELQTEVGGASSTGFIASAMGLVFSVDKYTADLTFQEQQLIDSFFESMKWDDVTGDYVTDLNLYGSLMNMVDFKNRWVYKGSVTTPPCATYVYWNVLSTIYPIKAEHLALFQANMDTFTTGLSGRGNWRAIQNIDDQGVIYVKNGLASQAAELAKNPEKAGGLIAATVIFALIAFFALIGCAVFGYQANQKGEAQPKQAEQEMAAAPAEDAPKQAEE